MPFVFEDDDGVRLGPSSEKLDRRCRRVDVDLTLGVCLCLLESAGVTSSTLLVAESGNGRLDFRRPRNDMDGLRYVEGG